MARLGPQPDWLYVRSWREQTWRSFRGRPFLTHCGRSAEKHGAVQQSLVDPRNGGPELLDARVIPP
jgi:hypothetical protein